MLWRESNHDNTPLLSPPVIKQRHLKVGSYLTHLNVASYFIASYTFHEHPMNQSSTKFIEEYVFDNIFRARASAHKPGTTASLRTTSKFLYPSLTLTLRCVAADVAKP